MKTAYIFFNCDQDRSNNSMYIRHNTNVFRDVRDARRELWKEVKNQVQEGNVYVEENNVPVIREAILKGNPTLANSYMLYGYIQEVTCY